MKNWILSEGDAESIVLSSRIMLSRNIENEVFPKNMNFLEARKKGKIIFDILNKEIKDDEFTLFEMWNDSEDSFKKYIEQGLITRELVNNSNKAAFILNKDETVSVMVNEKDHIKIQCITEGLNLDDALTCAFDIDDSIEKRVRYAFDEKLGYLTTSLSQVGTGLNASVLVHLPALTMNKEINKFITDFKKLGIKVDGLYEKDKNVIGNLYTISNIQKLGLSEEEIINKVKKAVLDLVAEEKKYREILIAKCKYEIEDKVCRAYGIINNAVLLDFSEVLELLSNIRLGVEMSILDVSKSKLNRILATTNDFTLQSILNSELDSKQIRYERCKVIKGILV